MGRTPTFCTANHMFRLRNKKMFRDRTELMLFRAKTIPETVSVLSLVNGHIGILDFMYVVVDC